jgi:hypothetical protein
MSYKLLQDKQNVDVMSDWREEFTKRIQTESKCRKESFTFYDAWKRDNHHTKRDKVFLSVVTFLRSEPLRNNDYVKFVSCYIKTGRKLIQKTL